jgi:hypothetical protein
MQLGNVHAGALAASLVMNVGVGAFAAAWLVGCGDNAPPECAGKTLTVYQFGEPQLLLLRTHDVWEPLASTDPSEAIAVCLDDEEYAVISVCVTDGRARVYETFATVSEVDELFFGTCNPGPFEGELATVRGTMRESGAVWLGGRSGSSYSMSLIGPWTFDLPAIPGVESVLIATDDIGQFGGASRIAIRRGLAFQSDTEVSELSLAAEGEPLLEVDVAIENTQPDETSFHTSTAVIVDGAYAEVSDSLDARARFVSNLLPGDEQYVSLDVSARPTADLSTSRRLTTSSADFSGLTFPPRLEDVVQFGSDGLAATWSELPTEYSELELFSASASIVVVRATRRWIDSHQVTSLALDTNVPGFDPTWLAGVQRDASFYLVQETADHEATSSVSKRLGTASLRDLDRLTRRRRR